MIPACALVTPVKLVVVFPVYVTYSIACVALFPVLEGLITIVCGFETVAGGKFEVSPTESVVSVDPILAVTYVYGGSVIDS